MARTEHGAVRVRLGTPPYTAGTLTWICLVDDDADVRDLLSEVLRDQGYEVQAFGDGSDALEAIDNAASPPGLVLLDWLLPHMTGHEVLRRIRTGRAPEVPVVLVTGIDVSEADFHPDRVQGILRKPVAIDRLLAAVVSALPGGP